MRFLRRYARVALPGPRFVRPSLEPLEIRLAMSSAAPAPPESGTLARSSWSPTCSPARPASSRRPSTRARRQCGLKTLGVNRLRLASHHNRSAQLTVSTGIEFGSIEGNGSGQTIAIVDAYDDPDLVDSSSPAFGSSDLARFDQAFGLPDPPSFVKLNEYGSATDLPGTDPAGASNPGGDWELEEALDVEWAHAIAPAANIILIETNSDNGGDMYTGATTAAGLAGSRSSR